MKKLLIVMVILLSTSICQANVVHQFEDSIPMDKWAHMGAGYFFNDQLKRNTKLTPLERLATIAFLSFAKERWADAQFDKNDIAATLAGGLFYEVKF